MKREQLLDKIFSFVKCDIRVPDHLIEQFSEYSPVYKNCSIEIKDIGETMLTYCESIGRKTGVKRSLISSMHGKGIIVLTPLLQWYLENGLVVGDVDQDCDERRAADIGGPEKK